MEISRPDGLADIADLGLTLAEAFPVHLFWCRCMTASCLRWETVINSLRKPERLGNLISQVQTVRVIHVNQDHHDNDRCHIAHCPDASARPAGQHTLKVPDGLAFSEFKDTTQENVAVSETCWVASR